MISCKLGVYILGFGLVDLVLAQDAINTYLDGR